MKKDDVVKSIAKRAGVSQNVARACLNGFIVTVEEAVAKRDDVALIGFGTFKVVTRKERKGRNPQTGEELIIPATDAPAFKAGSELKDAVAYPETYKDAE